MVYHSYLGFPFDTRIHGGFISRGQIHGPCYLRHHKLLTVLEAELRKGQMVLAMSLRGQEGGGGRGRGCPQEEKSCCIHWTKENK